MILKKGTGYFADLFIYIYLNGESRVSGSAQKHYCKLLMNNLLQKKLFITSEDLHLLPVIGICEPAPGFLHHCFVTDLQHR